MPAGPPSVFDRQRDQLGGGLFGKVLTRPLRITVSNTENAAVGSVVAVNLVMVALVFVVPINQVHRAVRPRLKVDNLRPGVIEIDDVWQVMPNETRATRFQAIGVEAG